MPDFVWRGRPLAELEPLVEAAIQDGVPLTDDDLRRALGFGPERNDVVY